MKVTIIQTDLFWEDKTANLEHFAALLSALTEATDLIVLPEMFSTGFSMQPERLAEPMDGPTVQWMRAKAADTNAAMVGSLMVKDGYCYYNRLVWMFPDGTFQHYDKRHLFSYGTENEHYTAGTKQLLVNWKGWKICPLICYDLRFPVWSRNTIGYDLLLYVANWPERRKHAWNTLLAARAIENQSYTVGVNRIGADGNGVPHPGDSQVVDFMGQPLFVQKDTEAVVTVELDKAQQDAFRAQFGFLQDQDKFLLEG